LALSSLPPASDPECQTELKVFFIADQNIAELRDLLETLASSDSRFFQNEAR
jgi:hypothetical protein